ncbi:MAG: hypothetical protein NTV93_18800, partial [Verrucomicrobia bacterium]|nr:hypothetical protein [Verrucomicrobiota bacterium]
QPFLRCPQDSLLKVPPERLPRRAVRGLGAHNPHQTGSFHPLKTTKCRNSQSPFEGNLAMPADPHLVILNCHRQLDATTGAFDNYTQRHK